MPIYDAKFSDDLESPEVGEKRNEKGPSITPLAAAGIPDDDLPLEEQVRQLESGVEKTAGDESDGEEKVAARNVFTDINTDALSLYRLMNVNFKDKWLDWEPETLFSEIRRSSGEYPTPPNTDKIMAIQAITKSEEPWESWNVFEKIVVAFNNRIPNFSTMDHVLPSEISKTIPIMKEIRESELGDEILRYIAVICRNSGLVYLPPPLDIAQPYLDELGNDESLRDAIKAKYQMIDVDNVGSIEVDEDDPVDIGLARTIVLVREAS